MAKKTKKHKKTHCPDPTPPAGAQAPPRKAMPYPYDGLERPLEDLSTVQRLHLLEGLLQPSLALLGVLNDLCYAATEQTTTFLWPEHVHEVLTIAESQLHEAHALCTQWLSVHTTKGDCA
jgi:hypothetical protein